MESRDQKLGRLFYDNNYPTGFFNNIYNKCKAKFVDIPFDEIILANDVEFCTICASHVGKTSVRFVKALFRLCSKYFNLKANSIYQVSSVQFVTDK